MSIAMMEEPFRNAYHLEVFFEARLILAVWEVPAPLLRERNLSSLDQVRFLEASHEGFYKGGLRTVLGGKEV